MVNIKQTILKGGSLSQTCLIEKNNKKFVRKSVSLIDNREYGYVRWYSQLKKLQRYNQMFPSLFPKVLDASYDQNLAYFDIEYMNGYSDLNKIMSSENLTNNQISKINNALWSAFDQLHSIKYKSNTSAAYLYYKEEVDQKIVDARKYHEFESFFRYETYEFNGKKIYGIQRYQDKIKKLFQEVQLESEESIHGNPTLENTMYSFEQDKIVFIDPYEESIIDSRFLDYSMVLQSSNSLYEYINNRSVSIDNSIVWCNNFETPLGVFTFNELFMKRIDSKERELVDVLEATQFIRMLPFKCAAGNFDHAKYFYLHACHLLSKILSWTY
jgi:hypothetical protein